MDEEDEDVCFVFEEELEWPWWDERWEEDISVSVPEPDDDSSLTIGF